MKTTLMTADTAIAQAQALEDAQAKQAGEAMMEYEAAKTEVEKAMEKETEMAKKFGDLKAKSQQAQQEVVRLRSEQLEAQKKLAMVEVLAVNSARKNLAEQRQREKDALEATRRALDEARAAMGAAK